MAQAPFITPLDLHVLGTPPAFILSHDQTLKFVVSRLLRFHSRFCVRLPPSPAGSCIVSDTSPPSLTEASPNIPSSLPRVSLAFVQLPLSAGSSLPTGSLIFRGYSVFKGHSPSISQFPSLLGLFPPSSSSSLSGSSFSHYRPLKRGERYYINSIDFVKGFFIQFFAFSKS